jgi:hypothetical protein
MLQLYRATVSVRRKFETEADHAAKVNLTNQAAQLTLAVG